jgi:broad specificity phosphatase PhoE
MFPHDLYLVRHGESEGNIANSRSRRGDHSDFTPKFMNRHSSDLRLTSKGRAQAKAVGDWFRENTLAKFSGFCVSTYARALETASLLGIHNAKWNVDDRLRERDSGSVDIIPNNLRQERMAEYLKLLGHRPYHHFYTPLPDGESICDVTNRLHSVVNLLDWANAHSVIIVAHGDVIRALRIIFEEILPDRYHELIEKNSDDFKIGNGQIIHYTRCNGHVVSDYFCLVRSINPWNPQYAGHDWRAVKSQLYSKEELMALAEKFKRLVSE